MPRRFLFTISLQVALNLIWSGPAQAGKPRQDFQHYAVAAGETQANQAGVQVLEMGGNAADAAAAVMLTLGVTSATSSGLGGGGFALYYDAKKKTTEFLDFRERAPAAVTPSFYAKRPVSASRRGGSAVAVPGEPAGIALLLKRHGRLPRTCVTSPAIRLASNGFFVTPYVARALEEYKSDVLKDRSMKRWLGSPPPKAGAMLRNAALAETLQTFAKQGAQPFYQGAIAKQVVHEVRARGGVMTAKDLQTYKVVRRKPLRSKRLGYTFVTAPPPSAGGYTLLASLALLEQWKLPKQRNALYFHALAESWKGPYWDRAQYFADPDYNESYLSKLLAAPRLAKRAAVFSRREAQPSEAYALPLASIPAQGTRSEDGGTSHICVVDAEGNVAAVTTSVNYFFGAQFLASGMVMNNTMDDFGRQDDKGNLFGLTGGARNLPQGKQRPISSMTPTIVFEDGRPVLCVGGSGGSRIITGVEQVILNTLKYNDNALEAIARPRIHHQGVPTELSVPESFPREVAARLRKLGHRVETATFASKVNAIRIRYGKRRSLQAASDVGKGAYAAGR